MVHLDWRRDSGLQPSHRTQDESVADGVKSCNNYPDSNDWPYKEPLIRGTAQVEPVHGTSEEYANFAERYIGYEQEQGFVQQFGQWFSTYFRIAIRPEWVGLLSFEDRWTSAIEKAMAG